VPQRDIILSSSRAFNNDRIALSPAFQPKQKTIDVLSRSSAKPRTPNQFGSRVVGSAKHERALSTLDSPERKQQLDRTFMKTGLSVGVVAGTTRTEAFGFDFYKSP